MVKNITLLFLFFIFSNLNAQPPDIGWQKLIGGNSSDLLQSIVITTDGGLFIGGRSRSNISGDKTEDAFNGGNISISSQDYWVIKLDNAHNIEWQRTIGGITTDNELLNEQDNLSVVKQTFDGGYIVGGWSNSGISGNKTEPCKGFDDYWIVKMSSSGVIEWQKTYGGDSIDYLFDLIQTADGGYILAGASASSISGDKIEESRGGYDGWIIKIDSLGNIIWQKTIGGTGGDLIHSVRETPEGGLIIGASSNSPMSGEKTEDSYGGNDYWIIKTDVTGNIEWQKTIGGANSDSLDTLILTNNGGYLAGGTSNSSLSGLKTEVSKGGYDFWIVKLDNAGAIEWQKTLGGTGLDSLLNESLLQCSDDGFLISGLSDSDISGDKTTNSYGTNDSWVLKLNSLGVIEWQKTIGGTNSDYSTSAHQEQDGGFILGGVSYSSNSGSITETNRGVADYWIVKLNPENLATQNFESFANAVVWPNPTSGNVSVNFEKQLNVTMTLTNILGQVISTEQFEDISIFNYTIKEEAGIYFLKLRNADGETKVFKVIKE